MKKFVFLFIFGALCTHFCQNFTEGFTLSKISTTFLKEGISTVDETQLLQPYHYFAKGGQSYVFLSEDGKYVLKLPRSSRLNKYKFISRIFPHEKLRKRALAEEGLLKAALQSHQIAFEHLKRETGLVSIHLTTTTELKEPLKIVDKVGITHTIDPNLHPFIIQKKVTGVKEKIEQLMNEQQFNQAEDRLRDLFTLIGITKGKGIEDEDPNLVKNFGFSSDTPIQIDTGRFRFSPSQRIDRIANSKEDLQHWINANYPTLSNSMRKAYKDYLDGNL